METTSVLDGRRSVAGEIKQLTGQRLLNIKKRLKSTTYIAPQNAKCSCRGALRHRQSGRAT